MVGAEKTLDIRMEMRAMDVLIAGFINMAGLNQKHVIGGKRCEMAMLSIDGGLKTTHRIRSRLSGYLAVLIGDSVFRKIRNVRGPFTVRIAFSIARHTWSVVVSYIPSGTEGCPHRERYAPFAKSEIEEVER